MNNNSPAPFILFFIFMMIAIANINNPKTSERHYEPTPVVDTTKYTPEYFQIKRDLIQEVDSYIQDVAPKSQVTGQTVVDACLRHDMDIVFVLAQGQNESHFGTAGIARKTNSVFNVMSYDDRSADDILSRGHGYSHPDQSVEPYIRLIRNDYMVDGKTAQDLMVCFVNKDGHRYASNPQYENTLRCIYNRIDNTTNISELYSKCTSYNFH